LIMQIDLGVLLDQDPSKPVDMKAMEAKLREIEKLRADLHSPWSVLSRRPGLS